MGINTTMVCHCNWIARALSLSPSPLAQFLTVEVTGRGPLSSLPPSNRRQGGRSHIRPNLHGWESIASRLFDHHCSRGGSWNSPRRSLFKPFWRLLGMAGPFAVAGGWRMFSGLLLLHGGWPPSKNRLAVMFLRTTISSLVFSALAPKESIDSTSTCSVAGTSIHYFSTGVCKARPWKTVSSNPSLAGTNEPTLIKCGLRSRASPTVSLGGKNPWCRISMYDRNGLPIVKAYPEGW